MELSDVFVKIATSQALTPEELDFLKRTGTETQQRNAKVASWTGADGSLTADTITTNRLQIGKELYLGVVARYTNSVWTCPNSTWTTVPSWNADYEDFGFRTENEYIYIPLRGRYLINFSATFDTGSTGYRTGVLWGYTISGQFPPGVIIPATGNIAILNASGEIDLEAGDPISLRFQQTEGSSLIVGYTSISFRKIR
jgi:hypothetical protein